MKRLVLLVAVVFALSSVASAAIITSVDRSGGASGNRDHIGVYDGEMDPEASHPDGLKPGVYIFSDRDYLYAAGGVPAEVLGAEYIVTYNSDKGKDGSVTYAVTTSTTSIFAIGLDDRFGDQQGMIDGIAAGVVPAGTFVDSGLDLMTGEDAPKALSLFTALLPAGTHTFEGYGFGGSNNFMVMGAMIPEPMTIALLGLGGLGLIRRKR